MKHLKVWQKLVLMGFVFLVPLAVVSYRMAASIDTLGVEFARQEVRGLEYYGPLLKLTKDLQLHRGIAHALLSGDASVGSQLAGKRVEIEADVKALDEIDRRLDGSLDTTKAWTVARTACQDLLDKTRGLPAVESFERHSRLIADLNALIAEVGGAANLTLDPDLERKHLVDVLIVQGPELAESLAQARGIGRVVAADKNRTPAQIERLSRDSILVEILSRKLDDSIARALAIDGGLKATLEAPAQASSDAVLDALAEIVKLGGSRTAVVDPVAYFATLTRAVDAVFEMETQIATSLKLLLDNRISSLRREVLQTLAGAGLGVLIVCVIGFFIMRDITVSLGRVVDAANRIAAGDLSVGTTLQSRTDELGVLARAFDKMATALRDTVGLAGRIAGGDLAQAVKPRSDRDEMGLALANMVERLSTLVGAVHRSGIQVNTSVNEIAATAKQQQATATEIAATTTEIGATSKEISATSRELVKTMNEVAVAAEQSATLAGSGQAGLTRMEETMRQVVAAATSINAKLAVLNEKAGNINQVVTTITKVADQTNLLSLNAAIEAEKAGEYGRGFAVVATEIRRLADQTGVATYDIEQMVKEIQSAVAAGVMGMDKFSEEVRRGMQEVQQVGGQLSQIIQQVQALAPRCEAVTEGMQAQAAGAEQIAESLVQLGEAAQQTVESLRQSSQIIEGLNDAATDMRSGVSRFRLVA